jgi:hypothetical protein
MSWEYLQTSAFDNRLLPIADFLKGRTKNKRILDLDCGTAPLATHLEPDWRSYVGNDIRPEYSEIAMSRGVDFRLLPDTAIAKGRYPCDILLSLGLGGGDMTLEPSESPTLRDSILTISRKRKPSIVILEGVNRFEERWGYYSRLVAELRGYQIERQSFLNLTPDWVGQRQTWILTR